MTESGMSVCATHLAIGVVCGKVARAPKEWVNMGKQSLTRLTWIFGFFWYGRKFGSGFLIGMFGREKWILGF